MKSVVLACAIPIFKDKILIIQRSRSSNFLPGNWGLPCGKINYDEDAEKAAMRELKEETGLTGDLIKIVGTSKFVGVKDKVKLHNLQINYLVYLHGDSVKLDSSSENYQWVQIEAFENSVMDDFNKQTVRQALDFLPNQVAVD